MSLAFPYTPFPFNVTPISPAFHLSPVTSNTSLGWVPSCKTPECIPTASWSTSAINSTIFFPFLGWDVAFDGNVKGNMSIELFFDGEQTTWNPSGDTLFNLQSRSTDYKQQRNVTLKVLDASPSAQLTVTRARVNGSSLADYYFPADRWTVPSDDDRLEYTGFIPQKSVAQAESSTTYVSSRAGDTVTMQFNGSTFLIYGPCGPTNGLMKITVDNDQQTVNTSRPFASDDCLLFQAQGLPVHFQHQLLIENIDGRTLGIDRLEFFKIDLYGRTVMIVYVRKAVKRRENLGGLFMTRPKPEWFHS
ncbi:hypothetical protein B0J17DRAFT_746616 [Rhizoctonia solani]|nr:hypothetical protein B0J17DRAFT_746616 [Rhizoctonia solani]